MADSAGSIGRRKFVQLSSKRQHEMLAALARDTLNKGGAFETFLKRYNELQSWAGIDHFFSPAWLSEKEALSEFNAFHSRFSPTVAHLETVSETETGSLSWQPKYDIEVALDQVRSPFNVGSILRIIDNFGLKGLTHSSPWLRIDHPQLVKAARGCQKWIPVKFTENLPDDLSRADVPVIGIENDPNAISISKWEPPGKCILIVGNEEYGIADAILARCSQTVHVPMFGFKRSMNVHHALSIAAYKIIEKFKP